jgi:hypothetical protein
MIAEVGTIPYDGFVYSGLANERGSTGTSMLQSVQYSTDGEGAKLVVYDSCVGLLRRCRSTIVFFVG